MVNRVGGFNLLTFACEQRSIAYTPLHKIKFKGMERLSKVQQGKNTRKQEP